MTHLYIDSSAVIKLVVAEEETPALRSFLQGSNPWSQPVSLVSSRLTAIEVVRAARRLGPEFVSVAHHALRTLAMITMSREITERAGDFPPAELRTLDAIHCASAKKSGLGVLAYDRRLCEAARRAGLDTFSPE